MLRIRAMTAQDVPLGMRLKDLAGWNQTEADWRRLLVLEPAGCFVAEWDGRPVATTCVSVFPPVGWVSMVLVDPPVRGRGIATRLMEHGLAYLDGRGVPTVRLDATALGRPVYERLGFAAEYEVARWEGFAGGGPAPAGESMPSAAHNHASRAAPVRAATVRERCSCARHHPGIAPVGAGDAAAVAALDAAATGADRSRLLDLLRQEQPDAMKALTRAPPDVWRAAAGESTPSAALGGYSWVRPGSRAMQIGPVAALDDESGRALADAALCACAGRTVFVDIPVPNLAAMLWAESRGLRVQRRFTRMRRGRPAPDQPLRIWAGFGPEKG
ncbi:MAG: GNAT family N-acetyltransferase [Planctomycetes bacterium]|nr:GNAT family N-acetyltransferase [Planctomycetota bacterium]